MLWISFVFGAIFGSFLNVVLLRKNTGESAVWATSRCFSCGRRLSWFELVPILSFVLQKGKCRKCGSGISWQYPIIEVGGGIIGGLIYLKFPISNFQSLTSFLFYFFAFCALLLVAAYDFKHKIIDGHFLYIFGGFAVVEFAFKHLNISTFISAFFIFLFFYLLWRLSRGRWMGGGDSNLAFFLAIFLGYPLSMIMVVFSFWFGAVVGIFLLLLQAGKFTIKSEVPFGPFLAAGTFVAWYFKDFLTLIYEFLYF